eukprot:3548839-Prymnesium_polylepis.1
MQHRTRHQRGLRMRVSPMSHIIHAVCAAQQAGAAWLMFSEEHEHLVTPAVRRASAWLEEDR